MVEGKIYCENNSVKEIEENDMTHDMSSECYAYAQDQTSPNATMECNTVLQLSLQESQPTNLHAELCQRVCVCNDCIRLVSKAVTYW